MEPSERDEHRQRQTERVFGAILALLVGVFLLASLLTTTRLWELRVVIAAALFAFAGDSYRRYARDKAKTSGRR